MKITIYEDRSYSKDYFQNEGTEFENKATTLLFDLPEVIEGYNTSELNKYIVFDIDGEQNKDILTSENTYILPNSITELGKVKFNLYLVEASTGEVGENLFQWISKEIVLNFNKATEAKEVIVTEQEIDIFNSLVSELNGKIAEVSLLEEDFEAAITQVENLNIEATKTGNTTTVTITKKDGTTESVEINDGTDGQDGKDGQDGQDGQPGQNGKDAKINGKNSIEIEAGNNITIDNTENGIRINSTGGSGGTSNYNALTNKPKINNVELNGNKTSSDLGLQPAGNYALESDIPTKTSDLNNDSGFIDKNVNNLTNYYKTSETYNKTEIDNKISSVYKYKGTVATYANLPSSDLTVGDVYNVESTGDNYAWTGTVWDKLGGDIDLSGYQPKIDSTHKLSSDLVDDTGNTNKFVTSTDKTNWNAKYDKPSGGIPKTDLASDVQTSLGKADTALQEHQDISGKANKISVVQTSTSTIEINSNTFYKFGEVASLNITLASITDNTIYNEYMFEFVSGTTATTLTLPSSIKWLETPTIDANKIYQCSIVDNVGLLVGVANV